MGIHYNTYTNWLKQDKGDLRNEAPHPNNEFYSDKERQRAIEALCKYPDLSVYQLQAKYLDEEGIYLGSVSWLYSVLKQIKTKKTQLKNDTIKTNQKLLRQSSSATDVNQVWCWDITYLYSPIVGKYYYLYSIMDLYRRYIVHYEVHDKQSDSLVKSSVNLHGINKIDNGTELILHSDNGGPMKGQTMQAACLSLGILCTYNRPRTSNDNAHMESSFKLLKHGKIIEIRTFFESLTHARKWCDEYYNWYNTEHRHSAICYITPENCYRGYGSEIMNKRNKIVQDFYTVHKQNNALRDNAGGTRSEKKAHIWRMPTKVDIMPFYTRRKKTMQGIKNAGYCGIDI